MLVLNTRSILTLILILFVGVPISGDSENNNSLFIGWEDFWVLTRSSDRVNRKLSEPQTHMTAIHIDVDLFRSQCQQTSVLKNQFKNPKNNLWNEYEFGHSSTLHPRLSSLYNEGACQFLFHLSGESLAAEMDPEPPRASSNLPEGSEKTQNPKNQINEKPTA